MFTQRILFHTVKDQIQAAELMQEAGKLDEAKAILSNLAKDIIKTLKHI